MGLYPILTLSKELLDPPLSLVKKTRKRKKRESHEVGFLSIQKPDFEKISMPDLQRRVTFPDFLAISLSCSRSRERETPQISLC